MTRYAPHEAAERTGCTLDTLRYYERIGLLDRVERTTGGRRVYDDEQLAWLRVLLCLRHSGMPVREMRRYAELAREGTHTADERERILQDHRAEITRRIAELRDALAVVDGKLELYRGRPGARPRPDAGDPSGRSDGPVPARDASV